MNNEIKLRQRFCKDCDIPVNIFDEPYFSDRLKLFDFLYDSVSKWDLFKSELTKYDSAIDYFADYSRIKDEAIETVRGTEGFQLFTAYGINDFSIKNKGLPVNKIYNPENNGRVFLSIDMKKANFSALHEYRDDIFGGSDTWEDFISRFTDNKHIINSKYIRQVIMGNLNPKRQTAYEKMLMDKLLTDILHANVLMFATNAIQTKTAHADLDSDQMHYSIRLCVKNVMSLIKLGLIMYIIMYYNIQL